METSLKKTIIALDAMGGDNAPYAVLAGANQVAAARSDLSFLIFGDCNMIEPMISKLSYLKKVSTLIHTDKKIEADDKPSYAIRHGRDSSLWLAIEAVKEGKAQAIVSSGNTGALMAISKIMLKTLHDIDRPAITTVMPTIKNKSVMLDLGANVDCTSENLFQFALMGSAFAKVMLNVNKPSIGLLNIGSEDVKGNDIVKAAATKLRETDLDLNFYGYVEGNDIAEGTVDVIVTDGFSGNIALKTAEGTAKICRDFLKKALQSSLLTKIGFLLAKPALKKLSRKLDHRLYNGAMFLGLNGIVVKSHGSTDAVGFANAINVALELANNKINEKITSILMANNEEN